MIISVKIGYNSAIMFKDRMDAWGFIDSLFNAAFYAENPEDMSIEIIFDKEKKEDNEETEGGE